MKALIKGGLFLTLGWLANVAPAQEPQWRAAPSKNPIPSTGTTGQVPPAGGADSGVRAVSVGQPTPLEPTVGSFRPIVRAQAADDKTTPLPSVIIGGGEPKAAKPLPKEKGFPPPPVPMPVTPSLIFGGLGLTEDGGCGDVCGLGMRRKAWGGAWGGGWGDDCCPDRGRGWVSAEYLMWWQRAMSVPTLVSSAPIDANGNLTGAMTSLYDNVPERVRSGGRFSAGIWLPHCCNLGLDVSFFSLAPQTSSATFASSPGVGLFRPFTDVTTVPILSAERADMVTIQTTTQLWGIEANLRKKWRCGQNYWIDCLMGYRHLNLNETIDIAEDRAFVPIGGGAAIQSFERESFGTRNQFNGMQMGLTGECRIGYRCFFGFNAKVAMGTTHQVINIDGTTTFVEPGFPPATARGALLAGNQTNIGQFTANRFGVVPEVGLKFGIDVTDHLRVYAGYDFIYWSSVLRPGDQIDQNVNRSFRPFYIGQGVGAFPGAGGGERRPMVPYRSSDFWAQGFNFGVQYRY